MFGTVRGAAPVPYPTILAAIGTAMSETSLQTILQRLADDKRMIGHTTPCMSD